MEFTEVVGWMAFTTSVIVQLVGIEVCMRIIKKGSTGDISPIPFLTYFIVACLWAKYGIIQNITQVLVVNSFASLLQFLYLVIYYTFTVRKSQFVKLFFLSSLILFMPLIYVKYYQEDEALATAHFGSFCVLMSIVAYGAPLASLKDVVRTRSTECMSFPVVFANFVVAIEWFVYGITIKDINVQCSNFLGAVLCFVQLGLFLKYPSKQKQTTTSIL
ncbi:sugar transporter SWEET1-like [Pecten maximus]|uniref:sugar transporter SWEET1-like n=1 Tax=Pecten maximus TaxID=6579 RepID=UPI0014586516|nr:sugar transporter SWEET1-like [Pecten maximus]